MFLHAYEYVTLVADALGKVPKRLGNKQGELTISERIKTILIMLYFDLRPGQKCHSRWCTGRKWHILMAVIRGNRVGGNWLMKWDELKIFPGYTHRLIHRKRVTCELHDSYFRLIDDQNMWFQRSSRRLSGGGWTII